MIIAKNITPHVSAEEYMDKEDKENELKQGKKVPLFFVLIIFFSSVGRYAICA